VIANDEPGYGWQTSAKASTRPVSGASRRTRTSATRLLRPRDRCLPERRRACRQVDRPAGQRAVHGTAGTPGGSNGVVGPYGLGVRVPLLVVSPWSGGGWVCSETFDHTSLIRFLERRFDVHEPNITTWRRAVCGDLTSASDFESASDRVPALPSVAAYKPNQSTTPPSYHPIRPAVGSVPTQEPGVRPSRRLGYRIRVGFEAASGKLHLAIKNQGTLGVGLQARSLTVAGGHFSYTIGAGDEIAVALADPGTYDLSLHGLLSPLRGLSGDDAAGRGAKRRRPRRAQTPDHARRPSSTGRRRRRRRVRRPPAHRRSRHK
jgi:Phosphoesterase family/Domain of unknown function (DUF756)